MFLICVGQKARLPEEQPCWDKTLCWVLESTSRQKAGREPQCGHIPSATASADSGLCPHPSVGGRGEDLSCSRLCLNVPDEPRACQGGFSRCELWPCTIQGARHIAGIEGDVLAAHPLTAECWALRKRKLSFRTPTGVWIESSILLYEFLPCFVLRLFSTGDWTAKQPLLGSNHCCL